MITLFVLFLLMVAGTTLISQIKTKLFGKSAVKRDYYNLMFEDSLFKLSYVVVPLVFAEELIFRLGLIGWLGGGTSHFWIALSVVLFAALHMPNYGGKDGALFMLAAHIVSGAILTTVYLSYGFVAVVLFHLVYNAVALTFNRVYYKLLRPEKLADIQIA